MTIPSDSLLALQTLRHDDESERRMLETAAQRAIEEAEEAKWPRALQWFENVSYLCGNHRTRFYRSRDGLGTHTFGIDDTSPYDSAIAQVADNRLVRPYETVIGMLTQTRPRPRVTPASTNILDEDAARIGELLIELLFENPMRMTEQRAELASVAMICGSAFAETEYAESDIPTVGRKIAARRRKSVDGTRQTTLVDAGEAALPRMEMQSRVWTPFHLSADPRATSERDAIYFIRSTYADIEEVREQYTRDDPGYYEPAAAALATSSAAMYPLYWWSRFQDVIDSPQWWSGSGLGMRRWMRNTTPRHQTLLSTIDVRPSRAFPRGRTLVVAGGQLLYCGDARAWSSLYPWRWHLYSFFHWMRVPGRFLGVPLLSLLVPLQKRINRVDHLVQANREHMSIGQWKYARQSRVTEGQITGIPGQHIQYQAVPGVAEPHKVEHAPLPPELLVERSDLLQAIDVLSASGIIGADLASSAARAGVIFDFLREERMRSKGPMLASFEQMLESIAQNVLIETQLGLLREDGELSRRLSVAAASRGLVAIESFTGASLRDHHAVRIDITSELREAPEARREMAAQALQILGGSGGPAQTTALLRAMGLGEFLVDERSRAVERARRLIATISSGDYMVGPEAESPDIRLAAAARGLMPGIDPPAIMAPVFAELILSDPFRDLEPDAKGHIIALYDILRALAQEEARALLAAQQLTAARSQAPGDTGRSAAA